MIDQRSITDRLQALEAARSVRLYEIMAILDGLESEAVELASEQEEAPEFVRGVVWCCERVRRELARG